MPRTPSRLTAALDAERWATISTQHALVDDYPIGSAGESLLDAAEKWREAGDPQRADDLEKEAVGFREVRGRLSERRIAALAAARSESWALRLADFVGGRSRPIDTGRMKPMLRRWAEAGAVLPKENTLQEVRGALEDAAYAWETAGDERRATAAFRLARTIGARAPVTRRSGSRAPGTARPARRRRT